MMRYRVPKFIVVAAFFLSALALPLKAADVGLAFGLYGTQSTFDTTGTEFETTGNTEQTSTSVSKDVDFGSYFIEIDAREGLIGFALGLEHIPGSASLATTQTRTDTTTDAKEDSQDDGTYTAKAKISDHLTVYIEPTFYPHANFGLYLKGGVSHITVETLESLAIGTDSSTYENKGVWGALFGVGVRATHSSGFFAKLEHTQTDYGTVILQSTTGNKNRIEADPEQKSTRFAIGYKF